MTRQAASTRQLSEPSLADEIPTALGYSEEKIEHVKHCIAAHRFRSEIRPQTKETKILFDADKLGMLGATGFARSFMMADQYDQKSIWLCQPRKPEVRIEICLKTHLQSEVRVEV